MYGDEQLGDPTLPGFPPSILTTEELSLSTSGKGTSCVAITKSRLTRINYPTKSKQFMRFG